VPERRARAIGLVVCSWLTLFALLPSGPAYAQPADRPQAHPGATPDFLFGGPRGSVALRGGFVFARAGSDLFDFVTNQLTIEKRDFSAPAIGAELGIAITPRVEAVAGLEMNSAQKPSEYRRFIGSDQLPIEQETKLKTVSITGSVKFALTPRGRRISRLAWIPRGFTPYVGAGGGTVRYEFNQTGDFVDFVDLSVFTDVFYSKGWAPSAHAFGGADLQIYRRLFLQLEGRYVWASGKLSSDFIDFDPIDLAGFRTTVGVSVIF
jgi:hypothetical protein